MAAKFASVLSNPLVTNTIDGFLTGDVNRTSIPTE